MMKKIFILIILYVFFFHTKAIFAADFTSNYFVEYTLRNNNQRITSEVKFNVQITHHRSDIYVKKFFLIFPSVFPIKNLKARDDKGNIFPILTEDNDQLKIELEFTEPNTGKDSINNFFIEFTQDNLFKVNGNVWEVILPTIESRDDGVYQVIVNLPNNNKKISVSKPKVDQINGNQLIWNNPKTKTIYAIFGDSQFYSTDLIYNLQNTKIVPVYTDIAFPPDTLYQKIFVNKIYPLPEKIFLDSDGNYLARYILKPKESKIIHFEAVIGVYSKTRDDFKEILNLLIQNQKNYLLTSKDYWRLSSVDKYRDLKSASDIYHYLVGNFTYDYKKVTNSTGRMGAEKALLNPENVVCTEFTDSFIALAREKGIMSREMQGYGFSSDSQLRPLSLSSDLLHAWPEFYDPKLKIWVQVDPTWQNTSGIDYFSSFDLNHVVFTIHGKDPRYPYPAGTYKTTNSKDILIKPVDIPPKETNIIDIKIEDFTKKIYQQKKYRFKIKVNNHSNVFKYNQKIEIKSDQALNLYPLTVVIHQIAPYENREILIDYTPNTKILSKKNSYINIFYNQKKIFDQSVTIFPIYYDLATKFGYIGLGLFFTSLIIFYAKKRHY